MTTFDEREKAFEAGFAHQQEAEFKAEARRDRLLGLWAGELLGLSGDALQNYALAVMRADLREPGDEDVYEKIVADFAEKGVDIMPSDVRAKMDALLVAVRTELHDKG